MDGTTHSSTVLTGTNTYTQTTTFGTGTLQAGSAGAFSAASQFSADSSDAEVAATIDLAGFNETVGGLIASSTNDDPSQFDVVTNSRSTAATLTIAAGGPSTAYATQQRQIYATAATSTASSRTVIRIWAAARWRSTSPAT